MNAKCIEAHIAEIMVVVVIFQNVDTAYMTARSASFEFLPFEVFVQVELLSSSLSQLTIFSFYRSGRG